MTDLLILQLGYAFLLAALLSRKLSHSRALIGMFSLIWLANAIFWTGNIVTAVWMALLLGASLVMLWRELHHDRKARFTAEEEAMIASLLSGVPRSRARHFLDHGFWLNGKEGDVLTREGEPVGHLYYLAAGEARVISDRRNVGLCREGDLIGELTVLSGESASATVILSTPARFWCAPASTLRPYLDANDDIRRAIERGFANALRAKLRASNRMIAGNEAAAN